MSSIRQAALWAVTALCASAALYAVLRHDAPRARARFDAALRGQPRLGAELFARKGCSRCHAVRGVGGTIGPGLGGKGRRLEPEQLASAMWNHAPQMYERMQSERVEFPELSQEELAHVLAYLRAGPGEEPAGRR